MKKLVIGIILALFIVHDSHAQQLAFPGAEGYGKYTVGGRGGKVFEVTNLNDDGPGSLRAAVEASGPRTVVFRVSGTITLNSKLKIKHPYITIAGQTAPGDGICLRRYPLSIDADQVIIRFIRVRLGDESGRADDAVGGRYHKHIILDHISASWSVDEALSVYRIDSLTIQWCIISESLFNSNHPDDSDPSVLAPHGFGGIWGSKYSTYHHNLLADHSSRNPRWAAGTGYNDYRNNVIYNWGYNSCYGGSNNDPDLAGYDFFKINMVANYYKPGPATEPGNVSHRFCSPNNYDDINNYGKWYLKDNVMVGDAAVTNDNWKGVSPQGGFADTIYAKAEHPWPAMPIHQQTAEEAFKSVLEQAGCSFPKRDVVDARVIHDTRYGVATYEGKTYKKVRKVSDPSKICGIIDSPSDVGGWPELKSLPAPKDSDHDGMPDQWELKHGLNPNNPADGNKVGKDGYTMLENYLNSIN
jgi:pectate lyase